MSTGDRAGDEGLVVDDLRVHFHTDAGVVRAVDGVSFAVAPGETVALVGESGSGKSVTGMSLLGLLPRPAARIPSGEIRWRGRDLVGMPEKELRRIRGSEISMIFQDPMTSLNPVMTVGRQIVEMVRLHTDLGRREARDRAVDVLEAVGIPRAKERVDSYPHELSGGMRQRAMIAMAISCDPSLIIADEPTTALDVTVQAQVLDVLADVQERTGAAMILITHDLGVVAGVADRVMVMYAGRLVESAATDPVFYDGRHPYTLGLMASLPRLDVDEAVGTTTVAVDGAVGSPGTAGPGGGVGLANDDAGVRRAKRRLKPIEGQPPSLLDRPPGCSFHPRCDLADLGGACTREVPELREVVPGHSAACHFAEDLEARAAEVGTADATYVVQVGHEGPEVGVQR